MTSPINKTREWSIDDEWQDRILGRSCEFCSLGVGVAGTQSHGIKVADLRVSQWLLGRNQYVRGYSILVLRFHAVEIFELSEHDRKDLIDDIAEASEVLNAVFSPIKINLEMQGNVIPHLHCHIKPRFPTDNPGHARIFHDQEMKILQENEYQSIVKMLQTSLAQNEHRLDRNAPHRRR